MSAEHADLSLELLCVHHSLAEFDSGDPAANQVARHLYERTRRRDVDDILSLVVSNGTRDVVGIASVVDLILEGDVDAEGAAVEGRCLFYSLLAVDRRFRSGLVVSILLDELERVRERRFGLGGYLGEIAAPIAASGSTVLVEFLERRAFRPLRSDDWIWFRPAAKK